MGIFSHLVKARFCLVGLLLCVVIVHQLALPKSLVALELCFEQQMRRIEKFAYVTDASKKGVTFAYDDF